MRSAASSPSHGRSYSRRAGGGEGAGGGGEGAGGAAVALAASLPATVALRLRTLSAVARSSRRSARLCADCCRAYRPHEESLVREVPPAPPTQRQREREPGWCREGASR